MGGGLCVCVLLTFCPVSDVDVDINMMKMIMVVSSSSLPYLLTKLHSNEFACIRTNVCTYTCTYDCLRMSVVFRAFSSCPSICYCLL